MFDFIKVFNGWKTVISYLLLSVPGITDYPMLVDAIQRAISDPSKQNVINFVVQFFLAGSIFHKVLKNMKVKEV